MKSYLISICIPVYNSEKFLQKCLFSVINQDFLDYEIVIVNDASIGTDAQGRKCKKIVRQIKKYYKTQCKTDASLLKKTKFPKITYVEHSYNKGLVEARRTSVIEAKGIYILPVDSDDILTPGALESFASAIRESKSDIVQGASKSFIENENEIKFVENRMINSLHAGSLSGEDYFNELFGKQSLSVFMWGKAFKRELYLDALEEITPTYCNMAEDILQIFFISKKANSYYGMENIVYQYRVNTGMSSTRKIEKMRNWEMICSTASVFTILFNWRNVTREQLQKDPLTEEQDLVIRRLSYMYLNNNLDQLNYAVVPELKADAHKMLCDYWGESFVKHVEQDRNT